MKTQAHSSDSRPGRYLGLPTCASLLRPWPHKGPARPQLAPIHPLLGRALQGPAPNDRTLNTLAIVRRPHHAPLCQARSTGPPQPQTAPTLTPLHPILVRDYAVTIPETLPGPALPWPRPYRGPAHRRGPTQQPRPPTCPSPAFISHPLNLGPALRPLTAPRPHPHRPFQAGWHRADNYITSATLDACGPPQAARRLRSPPSQVSGGGAAAVRSPASGHPL